MPMRYVALLALITLCATLAALPPMPTAQHRDAWLDYHTRADSAHGFDVLSYDVNLTIDDAQEYIEGTVTATITAEQALSSITYELEALNVTAARVNGTAATFTYNDHEIVIDLPNIPSGETFTTEVDYNGNPTTSNDVYHLGMLFMTSYVFTLSDPSGVRWWMPAYDHPWDKAIVNFVVTARDDWTVACNGLRTSELDNGNGTKTTTWEGSNPMPPHLFVIHVGNFLEYDQSYGDLPIQNFIPENYYNNAVEDFSNLPFMIETFEELYGPYPFEKYGNVVVAMQTFGAMEHQTMTTMGSAFIGGNHSGERTIAHELAHQWFGNCVTPLTWKDVWLSEGFATYSEALYTEAWLGWEEAVDYVRVMIMNYYIGWAGGSTYTIYDPTFNMFFAPPQYEKAASVLHMLRLEVGDDAFFEILQTWFSTYHNGWGVTEEFIDVVQQVTGEDYGWFFDQWIYGEGTPGVEYVFFFNQDDPQQFRCLGKTYGNGDTAFTLHVPIVFENATGDRDSVKVLVRYDHFSDNYEAPMADWTSYEIDPNNWVLCRWHQELLPELSGVNALDGAVQLNWPEFYIDDEYMDYNVYRADSPDGPYVRLNNSPVDLSLYTDNGLTNGQTYYYKISAVEGAEYETALSNAVACTPMEFPMDRGVLLVDETNDGNASTPINPTDEMVDGFYQSVVNNPYRAWDYATEGMPPLDTLACYSTVFWIDDDPTQHRIEDNIDALMNYNSAGGNLIISGWQTAAELSGDFYANTFAAGPAQMWPQPLLSGVTSQAYGSLDIDTTKLLPNWNGYLAYGCTFPYEDSNDFLFVGEGEPNDQDCALKRMSANDGVFCMLGFPLYFMQADDVENMFDILLTELGETVSVQDDPLPPSGISLQVGPNPFRAGGSNLNVQLSLSQQSDVEAAVYNIRGQRVATLGHERMPAGTHSLTWDGRTDDAHPVASGVYLLHVKHSCGQLTRKVMLLR